jgi:hypothetical protein
MANVRVNILNSHIATYNGVTRNLKQGGVLYLDTDKIAQRKELMYLLTASPHRNKYAVELNDALLGMFNVSVLDTAPAHPADPEIGRVYWNTALGKAFLYNGQAWVELGMGGGGGGGAPIAIIPSLFGDVTSTGFSNEVQISPGVITDADISAGAKIKLSKLEVDPRNRATHFGVQPASSISDFDAQVRTNRLDQLTAPASSLNVNDQFITNLRTPINPKDAANKEYVDARLATINLCTMPPAACNIDMGGFRVVNLGNPVLPMDAVNLQTLQNALALSPIKAPARLMALSNVSTLSGTGVVIDGRPVVIGDRVVLNGQNDPRQNGIYVVSAGAWMRAPDADENTELITGSQISITDGATQGGTIWSQTQPQGQTVIGSSVISYSPTMGLSTFTAGNGLYTAGNTLHVGGTPNRIVALADTVDIAPTYVGQASITTVGPITTGQWRATPIDVTYGGTGATIAADARSNLGAAKSGANNDITSINGLTTPLSINQGGTGATTAPDARINLGAAARGVNSDITQITGLTTPLSISQGGTGANTAPQARANLQAAKSGVNSDITSFTALDPGAITVAQGGTGSSTPQSARVALGAVGGGLNLLGAASNRGQMFRQVTTSGSEVTMEFRVLEEGPGINLTQTTNSVVIEVDPTTLNLSTIPGQINAATQVTGILPVVNGGTGGSTPLLARQNLVAAGSIIGMGGTSLVHAVAYNPATTNLQIKGLTADPEIVITPNANDIRLGINQALLDLGSMGGQVNLPTQVRGILPIANGGTNASTAGQALDNLNGVFSARSLGGIPTLGTPIVENVPGTGERLLLKGFSNGLGTIITDSGTSLSVDISATNVGAGTGQVLKTPVGSALELRTITGVGSIVVTTVGDEITITGSPASMVSVGTGQPVLVTPTGNPVQLRSLLGRYGLIDSTVGQDVVLDLDGVNVGTGQGIYVTPTAASNTPAQFKSLSAVATNPGIVVTSTTTDVQLQAIIANAANLGAGALLLANPGPTAPGSVLNFRSIVGLNGITHVQNANDVTLSLNATNVGGGAESLVTPIAGAAQFRTFIDGAGVNVTQAATSIKVDFDGVSVGTGAPIYVPPVATGPAQFKSIIGGLGLTQTSTATDVTLDLNAVNVGGGSEVLVTPLVDPVQFRTLVEGNGINLTQAATSITVVADLTNLGAGAPLLVPGATHSFKSLIAGTGITITPTATDVTIASTLAGAINVGTGIEVLALPIVGGVMNFRKVLGRYGANASLVGSDVVIDYDAESVGAGQAVLVTPTLTESKAQYKSLSAVPTTPGLVVTSTATEVQFQTIVAGAINVGAAPIAPALTTAQVLANGPITVAGTIAQFKSITSSDNSVVITQTATQIDLKSNGKVVGFHTTAATFTQAASVSPNTQSITHNLGTNQIMVQVRDSSGEVLTNYKVTPGAAGSNTVGISWGSPGAVPVGASTVFVTGILP